MGEIISITIGSYDFISSKNTFSDLLLFYSPDDLSIVEDSYSDDEGNRYDKYLFITTVEKAKRCLDVLGYTIERAKKSFELSKEEDISFCDEYYGGYDSFGNKIEDVQQNFTFESWSRSAQRFALLLSNDHWSCKNLQYERLEEQRKRKRLTIADKYVLDSLPFNNKERFFGILFEYTSRWEVFRVLLEAFNPSQEIELDYTNLYNGGWCDEFPNKEEYAASKTIVLTEGKYDAKVISQSMQILYPYMYKFYSFIDFSTNNVQGSVSSLTQYVKAFAGAGIQNRVIALYDNDAIGQGELLYLKSLRLPENYRVMSLPNIDLAKKYPTVGPTTNECVDINGRACSIELYLGKEILTVKNKLIPVMWKGYVDRIKAYQGELLDKGAIQRKFEQKFQEAKISGIVVEEAWTEMDIVLKAIFSAFTIKDDKTE